VDTDHAADDIRDDTDHATDREPAGDAEVFASLANALQHIDAALRELKQGIETIIQRQVYLHMMGKRTEASLLRVEKSLTEDDPDA
jgi:hypothetical protein